MNGKSAQDEMVEHLKSRQAQFGPWFAPDEYEDDEVVAAVDEVESQWTDPRGEEETEEEYASRLAEDARAYLADNLSERLDELILATNAAVTVGLRVELSAGGPGEYLTADIDMSDGSLYNPTFHYVEWGGRAEEPLSSASPLHFLLQHYAEIYAGMGVQEIWRNQ